MPSNLPSSFASAAAGQTANRDARGGRTDGRGAASGDWARRDGRSINGTLTFRRSSTTPLGQPSSQPPAPTDNAVQPPASFDNPIAPLLATQELAPARYTKEDLLDMFRLQKGSDNASRLFIPGWNPAQVNGVAPRGWGKSNENHIPQEPGACWDQIGDSTPMGLQELSLEEKEAFTTEINSPLKPPTQNKEGHQAGGTNGRKASLSQGASNTFGVSSPSSAARPGTRRRETVDSNPFSSSSMASPTAPGRFSRDDPSYWFPRKSSELKENEPDDSDGEQQPRDPGNRAPPFGTLMRSNTGGLGNMGSIWPSSNPTTPIAGGFGNFALPSSTIGDKRAGGGNVGGSRLAHLMPKEGSDVGGVKLGEGSNPLNQQSWRSRPRTDTDPFGSDEGLSGSAVLGGAQDDASGTRHAPLGTPVKGSTGDFGMSGLSLRDEGPVSPSETNPYRSPPAERHEQDDDASLGEGPHGANPHEPPSNFGSISRGFGGVPFDTVDRSQTSSVGAKGYPSLSSLGGWPAPANAPIGTPDRERPNLGTAFGSSLFSPIGELQSPGLSNLNNVFGPASGGAIGTGSISRGSKLGSLFPPAMQAQMQGHVEHDNNLSDSLPDLRQANPLGAIGRGNFAIPPRETESPMRSNRGMFEELFPSSGSGQLHNVFSTAEPGHSGATAAAPQSFTPVGAGLTFGGGQGGTEPPPPPAQVRQMVMPDRMRWVYLDPQGQVQGPFTGLEMNDWYKANFFTPDLRVKKVEDPEFEPLGQLIRRIGNSREPFLVPQIGIPHGPPTQAGPFSPSNSGVIPPLSGVFPSFGRTLTAEEQNNLERRKQEEQFLMVQQREFVMRQQAMTKFGMQGPSLQHHSSAHSLQSQPSFGSMTSPNPIGMPHQQQPISAIPTSQGFFDGAPGAQGSSGPGSGNGDGFREEDLANLSAAERQVLATLQGGAPGSGIPPPIGAPVIDANLRTNLPQTEELQQDDEGFKERLQEFENLRAGREAEQIQDEEDEDSSDAAEESEPSPAPEQLEQRAERAPAPTGKAAKAAKRKAAEEALSLTQQVQKAQAAAAAAQISEPGMPMPFPPPMLTGTPLPAPTAQRARSNLPDQYNRSQTGTPDTVSSQPPPLAPWAKDPSTESQKGPSLKEIQEAEARKAAKAEEAAAALRRAAMEQEAAALREREKAAAAASLPATSTWAHGSPAPTGSPWVKPGPAKGPTPTTSASSGKTKTLAEIQREEELRKQKAKDAIIQSGGAPPGISKSYANLASKPGQPALTNAASAAAAAAAAVAAPPGAGWSTVGAGGKVKIPTGPSAQGRSVSSTNIKPVTSPIKAMSKPVAVSTGGKVDAMEEFNKWVHRELSRGITGVNDIATFQATLDVLPLDTGIIADAVYANSTTMDGRHFAEEFIRRKKQAERGIVEKQPSAAEAKSGGSAGGWSEVAKKGSVSTGSQQPRESDPSMQTAGFKVVPGRKKGKK
ncbi:hypothetical protein BGZ63DRAFT_428545 [Mariannaea sp. PMI_226]|nr:hypothetical protein BGZ63DRAFT_428545 [Mariannaea sp. PMI_226]